jgi:UDP-N-acetylmuramate--alanine ligase
MQGFAESLTLADELLLLDIYPARELPIEGVSSKVLFDKVKMNNKKLLSKAELLGFVASMADDFEVLLTIGAGDVGELVLPIKERLEVAVC